jgi:hypothetical protein
LEAAKRAPRRAACHMVRCRRTDRSGTLLQHSLRARFSIRHDFLTDRQHALRLRLRSDRASLRRSGARACCRACSCDRRSGARLGPCARARSPHRSKR